jgi:putative ABC transport system ATP-binding protein
VLADEPTGNLDALIGGRIGSMLAAYCRSEAAIVVVATHNELLAQLCDRVLILRDGRLSEQGRQAGTAGLL